MTTSEPATECATCGSALDTGAPFCGTCGTAARPGATRARPPADSSAPAASVTGRSAPVGQGLLARVAYQVGAAGAGLVAFVVGLFGSGPDRAGTRDRGAPPARPAAPASSALPPPPPPPPPPAAAPAPFGAPTEHPSTEIIAAIPGFARAEPEAEAEPDPELAPEPAPAPAPEPEPDLALAPEPEAEDLDDTRLVVAFRPAPAPRLTFDTGQVVEVKGAGVVGRNPSAGADNDVVHLVTLPDPERSVSKTHAAFGLDAGGLWVADRSSTNGTTVVAPDGSRTELAPGERAHVVPGTVIEFGDRNARVDAP